MGLFLPKKRHDANALCGTQSKSYIIGKINQTWTALSASFYFWVAVFILGFKAFCEHLYLACIWSILVMVILYKY